MRLYSYRGVIYTLAPASLKPCPPALPEATSPAQDNLEQDIFTTIPQTQTPSAAIPMRYRGILYMLERFTTPSSTATGAQTEQPESQGDESQNPEKQESTQTLDD